MVFVYQTVGLVNRFLEKIMGMNRLSINFMVPLTGIEPIGESVPEGF
jgi:hypothetical protein